LDTKTLIFILDATLNTIFSSLKAQSELELNYLWKPTYYGFVEGTQRLIYARSFARGQMNFSDLDGDFDKDLVLGKADGRLAYIRNDGDDKTPRMHLVTENFSVTNEEKNSKQQLIHIESTVDVGNNSSPELADIDNDGDLDLFVGSGDGQIFFYENRGNRLLPKMFRVTPIYMNLNFVGNSVPRFADLNGDRMLDLVVGLKDGRVWVYFNSGVSSNALYCPEFKIVLQGRLKVFGRRRHVRLHVDTGLGVFGDQLRCRLTDRTVGNVLGLVGVTLSVS